jgi:hypothetical protein
LGGFGLVTTMVWGEYVLLDDKYTAGSWTRLTRDARPSRPVRWASTRLMAPSSYPIRVPGCATRMLSHVSVPSVSGLPPISQGPRDGWPCGWDIQGPVSKWLLVYNWGKLINQLEYLVQPAVPRAAVVGARCEVWLRRRGWNTQRARRWSGTSLTGGKVPDVEAVGSTNSTAAAARVGECQTNVDELANRRLLLAGPALINGVVAQWESGVCSLPTNKHRMISVG